MSKERLSKKSTNNKFYKTNPRGGISLIVLVITIIVIIILAAAVIISLINNNPISEANRARYESDVANMQAVFTNTVAKVMAKNQGTVSIEAVSLNSVKSGVNKAEGQVRYRVDNPVDSNNAEGVIIFGIGEDNDTTYYTGKELPIYASGETIWYVDSDGLISVEVGGVTYGEGEQTNTGTPGTDTPVIADESGANRPTGNITGKEYVTWEWNESTNKYEESKTTNQPNNWYDYENGKWANIKTSNNGLEAYWVWIPRFEYVVPTSTVAQIEVKFINKTQTSPDTDKSYKIHPAFTNEGNGGFGELEGIWVAKYEASSSNPSLSYGGGNPTDTNPLKVQVKPGVQSWRKITAANIFKVSRQMTGTGGALEGATVDSHMMKNTEWGAVAILSQSKYGIYNPKSNIENPTTGTRRVWNNSNEYNSGQYIYTGYAGNEPDAKTEWTSTTAPTNIYAYDTKTGTKASTTGTVYGVYDMAGGSWEYVAGVIKGSTDELEYAKEKFDITNQGKIAAMTDADFAKKYLDLYNYRTSDSDYSQYIQGDATVETKGWNGDYSNFAYSSDPVFLRGR